MKWKTKLDWSDNPCPKCGHEPTEKDIITRPTRINWDGEGEFVCPKCDMGYTIQAILKIEKVEELVKTPKPQPIPPRWICDCGGQIVNHRGHTCDPDEIECFKCGKEYTREGNKNVKN